LLQVGVIGKCTRWKKTRARNRIGYSNPTNAYNTKYTYGANGNILTLTRNGTSEFVAMGNLEYKYFEPGGRKLNNPLAQVFQPSLCDGVTCALLYLLKIIL
jgi:hypothetical protein